MGPAKSSRQSGVLTCCVLWMLSAVAVAQESLPAQQEPTAQAESATAQDEPSPAANGTAKDESTKGNEKAVDPEAALREEARESAGAEGATEGGDVEDGAAAEQQAEQDEDSDFVPSEKIWADSALAFPSDI